MKPFKTNLDIYGIVELTAISKLQHDPLPTHDEMARYTHLELSDRPYEYRKGMIAVETTQEKHDITVTKKTYELEAVV